MRAPLGACVENRRQNISVLAKAISKAAVRGDGPHYIKLSARLVVYDRDDLDHWLAERRIASTAEAALRNR